MGNASAIGSPSITIPKEDLDSADAPASDQGEPPRDTDLPLEPAVKVTMSCCSAMSTARTSAGHEPHWVAMPWCIHWYAGERAAAQAGEEADVWEARHTGQEDSGKVVHGMPAYL